MTNLDRLSDTVYREQAIGQLDDLLGACGTFPVRKTQLYGLRQIARQEPGKVGEFAGHQRERAERKLEQVSERGRPALQAEIEFWSVVDRLCDSSSPWSVLTEGLEHAPAELRDENIPARNKGMTPAERTRRNQIKARQREWLARWTEDHVPAFFERFCTHALYRLEMSRKTRGENSR